MKVEYFHRYLEIINCTHGSVSSAASGTSHVAKRHLLSTAHESESSHYTILNTECKCAYLYPNDSNRIVIIF